MFLQATSSANGHIPVGLGIAFVAALRAKVPVLLHDRSEPQVKKGLALMDKLLEKEVAKACEPVFGKSTYFRNFVIPGQDPEGGGQGGS